MTATSSPAVRRWAIYVRTAVSVDGTSRIASVDQRARCMAYIRPQCDVPPCCKVYEDLGLPGSNLARPALQQLLADVGAGQIDVVVVCHLDRLSRSPGDLRTLMRRLKAAGASVVSLATLDGRLREDSDGDEVYEDDVA